MVKLNFSGHESFPCRELWLKKGFDFVRAEKIFRDPQAVVDLGVGKNMVSAIQYWMIAFNLLNSEKGLTNFAEYIFGPAGKDPFLEDRATLWLLHYQLIKKNHASIYSLFFNIFRKERPEFTKRQLQNFLVRKSEEHKTSISEHTIAKDVGVFLSTYLKPDRSQKEFDDLLAGLLVDLELVERVDKIESGESSWFWIINTDKEDIPAEVLLYCILDDQIYGDSISLHSLLTEFNSIGSIFAISSNGLVRKIKELTEKYQALTYMDDAGIKELQFKNKPDKWAILDNYYG